MNRKKILTLGALGILLIGAFATGAFVFANYDVKVVRKEAKYKQFISKEAVKLPSSWNGIVAELLREGVIDETKLNEVYAARGGLTAEMEKLLKPGADLVTVTEDNADFALNLLWALGLANKNEILESGPMVAKEYGGDASQFASTGGWTLARGDAMNHYSKHSFIALTPEQQELVSRVSKNIYRPCCNNSTYFPDCNHGMAMLGFLQLLAQSGATEEELYEQSLVLNSFWFPENYETINAYLNVMGAKSSLPAEVILGKDFSSSSGYRSVLQKVTPVETQGGGSGCSV